jgi:hypothetical protein
MAGTTLARGALACALALAAVAFAACGGDTENAEQPRTGPPRTFMMGFSSVPRELSAEAYAETFELAAEHGEMVLIQRTPPWEDFLPGGRVSDDTATTTAAEKSHIRDRDLRLFFAIDPTDGTTGRDQLAGLPAALSARDFSDPDVRRAFVAYAEYVAINYRPEYLALGVEMNQYYTKNKDGFEDFKTLYAEAYATVKKASPDTKVTVTMQYEDLQGILPTQDAHFPDWQLLRAFEPNMDIVTISTYPSFSFASADAIPENYYTQLRAFTDLPIAIAQMGYSSAEVGQGVSSGSESDQAAFLRRALADAEEMEMRFVVWFAGWDPSFAREGAEAAFQHIGLLRGDNSEKPAWSEWLAASRRPYDAHTRTSADASVRLIHAAPLP